MRSSNSQNTNPSPSLDNQELQAIAKGMMVSLVWSMSGLLTDKSSAKPKQEKPPA